MLSIFIKEHEKGNPLEYMGNGMRRSFPIGLDADIITLEALHRIDRETRDLPKDIRKLNEINVIPYIHQNPGKFKSFSYYKDFDLSHHRWTLDTPEDFELISRIYQSLYPENPDFLMKDILALLEKHPHWCEINSRVIPKSGYWTRGEKLKLEDRIKKATDKHEQTPTKENPAQEYRSMKYKAGLIGCGNIGSYYDEREADGNIFTHAGMYNAVGGFDLTAASDIDEKRLKECGNFWNIPRLYRDYREMLSAETFDIISIATPDQTHHAIIREVLSLNPPRVIFTEKPLANNVKTAAALYQACKEKNVILIVDYVRRWDKNHRGIKTFLERGKMGDIQHVVGYYVRGLRHNGCQMINLLHYLLGPITQVRVMGRTDGGSMAGDPSLNVECTLANGTPVTMIALDQKGCGFSIYELDIFGTSGRLRMLEGGQKIQLYNTLQHPDFPNFKKLHPVKSGWETSTYGAALKQTGEELLQVLDSESEPIVNTAVEAITDLCVIEAILESAKNNNKMISVKTFSEVPPIKSFCGCFTGPGIRCAQSAMRHAPSPLAAGGKKGV
jgi:predicted dehydrogenase